MSKIEKIKEKSGELRREINKKVASYITAGLGLVAGLAWNEAIKSLIDYIFPPSEGNGLMAKFIYALVITVVVVIVSLYLARILSQEKKK